MQLDMLIQYLQSYSIRDIDIQLDKLGFDHSTHQIQSKHYFLFGEALLATLEHFLGSGNGQRYWLRVQQSWNSLFQYILETIKIICKEEMRKQKLIHKHNNNNSRLSSRNRLNSNDSNSNNSMNMNIGSASFSIDNCINEDLSASLGDCDLLNGGKRTKLVEEDDTIKAPKSMRNFLVISSSPSILKSRKKAMGDSQKLGTSLRNLFTSSINNDNTASDDHTTSTSTGVSSSNRHDDAIFDDNHPHNVSLSSFLEQNNNSSSSFGGGAEMLTSPTGTPRQRRGVRPGIGRSVSSKSHRQHSRRDFAIALDDDDIKSVATAKSGRSLMTTQTAPADFVPTTPGGGVNNGQLRQRIVSKAHGGSGTGRSRRDLSILMSDSEDDSNNNSPRSVTASPSSTKQKELSVHPKSAGANTTRRPRRDCAVFSVDSPASAGAISTGRARRGVRGKLACPPPLSSPLLSSSGAGYDQKPATRKKLLHK
jgi:hypothetical protein